jgi:hypothetical protein
MTTPVLLVQGTHAWGRTDALQWWECKSAFCRFLASEGCTILGEARPFVWDTDLDGVGIFGRARRHLNWKAASHALHAYLRNPLADADYVPIKDRNIIAHSHGMQVVAYACREGLQINRLLTLGSPVRKDMMAVYKAARPNIACWRHVHSDKSDRIQWFGTLFDGQLGIVRQQPLADVNVGIPNVAHSRLLNDPTVFPLWRDTGLLDFLREDTNAAGPERPAHAR